MKAIYRIYATVVGTLWKAGLLLLVIGRFYPNPVSLLIALPLVRVIFFNPILWQSIGQIWGIIYAQIAYRFNLPSNDNYTCKVEYILPFTGKWTVFNGGVNKELSHSWGMGSQRYAYDFVMIDLEYYKDEGKRFPGDNKSLHSYTCYGKDIIAPADGVIVKVSNKHKDSRTDGKKAYCDTWDLRGNFIVIKHADYEYSMSAHLAPGSITVRVGDSVKQGEVIAKCGNSGNTSEPHLHFQLQSSKSFFTSAGLPIAFSNVSAQEKAHYDLADQRSCQNNLQYIDNNKVYIGRGLEVENEQTA